MELAALILGICSILFCAVPGLGLVMGFIAVVLGLKARGQANERGSGSGLSVAGTITGAIGAVSGLICTVAFALLIAGGYYSFTTYQDRLGQEVQFQEEAQQAAEQQRVELEAQRRLQMERLRAEQAAHAEQAARAEQAAAEAQELRRAQEEAQRAREEGGEPRRRPRAPSAIGDDPLGGLEL